MSAFIPFLVSKRRIIYKITSRQIMEELTQKQGKKAK